LLIIGSSGHLLSQDFTTSYNSLVAIGYLLALNIAKVDIIKANLMYDEKKILSFVLRQKDCWQEIRLRNKSFLHFPDPKSFIIYFCNTDLIIIQ
jgi:hypothetical protein